MKYIHSGTGFGDDMITAATSATARTHRVQEQVEQQEKNLMIISKSRRKTTNEVAQPAEAGGLSRVARRERIVRSAQLRDKTRKKTINKKHIMSKIGPKTANAAAATGAGGHLCVIKKGVHLFRRRSARPAHALDHIKKYYKSNKKLRSKYCENEAYVVLPARVQ